MNKKCKRIILSLCFIILILIAMLTTCCFSELFRIIVCCFIKSIFSWTAIGSIATAASAVSAVVIYCKTVKRSSQIETIKEFTMLREKYPNVSNADADVKSRYLKDLERFATGVNIKVYDIETIDKMSGALLISQFDKCKLENMIEEKRETQNNDNLYCEYEKMIIKLKAIRNKKQR